MENPFAVIPAEIFEIRQESPLIRTLRVTPEESIPFKTGQFIELTVPGIGEAPFTPSSSQYVTDTMDITIMRTGFVTGVIHELEVGDSVGLRGPYGSSYPLEKFQGKDLLILGGGCGLAPLRSLFETLLHDIDRYNSVTFCAGAKTPDDCIYTDHIDRWRSHPKVRMLRAVDEVPEGQEWDEDVCLVTKLLDQVDLQTDGNPAIVCGPPVMMKFGTQDLLSYGFREENIYLSMEKKMYCGFGECRHCMIGPLFVCKEGPVFTYDQIKHEEGIWE